MVNCEDKKNQIINIAFEFFLITGYEATTIRMICQKAKIEPPTLYYYFGSKKGLFFAIVDKMLDDYQVRKQENRIEKKVSPEDRLRNIYEYSVNYAINHIQDTKFYFRYTLFTPIELKNDIDNYMKQTYEKKDKLFKDCLTEVRELSCYKFDIDIVFLGFERLIYDSVFNVIFTDWRPLKEELDEIFEKFFYIYI